MFVFQEGDLGINLGLIDSFNFFACSNCCMASRSSFCSSTRNTIFPSSPLNYDPKPKWMCSSASFSQEDSGIHHTKHFQLKASNVQPLTAVSLKAGIAVNSLATEDVQFPIIKEYIPMSETEKTEPALSIIVVGASGDLARRKIFPALFSLFCEDRLPKEKLQRKDGSILEEMLLSFWSI